MIAAARLKHGWTQARVFNTLGPPEYVHGWRHGIQYWYYGAGWVRFSAGRLTGWNTGGGRLSRAAP
jgi:hypothetical protein